MHPSPASPYVARFLVTSLFAIAPLLAGCLAPLGALAQTPPALPGAVAVEEGIRVSSTPDRRLSRPLDGATVRGEVYIFFETEADIAGVDFRLIAADPPIYTSERWAPYDLLGGDEERADPLDSRRLLDGTHTLEIEIATPSGGRLGYATTFEVRNGGGAVAPGDLYVDPAGDDDAPGTIERPLASVAAALERARPGMVVYLRRGEYRPTRSISIERSGRPDAPIRLLAYPGERVAIDGTELPADAPIVRLRASHWVLKDFELRNGPTFGLFMEYARHNHIEGLVARDNGDSGFHLEHEASYNTFVASDAYGNYDVESGGQHADGFAVKRRTAVGNVFLLCRAWNNSDDGFDLLESAPQWIDRSAAFRNGYRADGTPYPNGDGNGFKLGIAEGRWQAGGGHLVTRSVAWGNETWGFNSNNGTVPITLYNNTAWENGEHNFLFNKGEHVLVNNLSFAGTVFTSEEVVVARNSWQLGVDDPGLESVDPDDPGFLLPGGGSAVVDRGVEVGLAFAGAAPDLGARERFP